MTFRGFAIIFASFLLFLGQCGYSNGACPSEGCMVSGLGEHKHLSTQGEDGVMPTENNCYVNGSVVTLSCAHGVPNVTSPNTCINGKWDEGPATCNVTCMRSAVGRVANLTLSPNKTKYASGDEVTFSCDKGYKLNSDSPKSARCNDEGEWSLTEGLECIAFNCSDRNSTKIEHLILKPIAPNGTYDGNATIEYSCKKFNIEGKDSNTCVDQDMWAHDHPTCRAGNVQVFWYFLIMTTSYTLLSFYM